MFRYRLRTLLILMAVGPVAIALWHWWGDAFMFGIDPVWDWIGGNYRRI